MFEFFNSEFATVTVNLIVIIGLLLFIYFALRKFLPSLKGAELKERLSTSTSSQNVFAFISVVVASTLLDLFTSEKFNMLWIVLIISILTIVFNVLYEKVKDKNNAIDSKEAYKTGLSLLEQIINCKGYSLIKNAKELTPIENNADEIYVFSENLLTDIGKECIDEPYENKGLFANLVAENIPKGKRYIYLLKDTKENRKYFKLYEKYHFHQKNEKFKQNVAFYFIPESDFCFFSEIYLYKDIKKQDIAFEWIPSIGEKDNENKQFYLQLSAEQTQNLNEILCELMISYERYQYKDTE